MQLVLGREKTTMGFPRTTRCAIVVSVHVVGKWERERGRQMAHVLWREAVRNEVMWVTYLPPRTIVMPRPELQPRAMCRPVTLLLQTESVAAHDSC